MSTEPEPRSKYTQQCLDHMKVDFSLATDGAVLSDEYQTRLLTQWGKEEEYAGCGWIPDISALLRIAAGMHTEHGIASWEYREEDRDLVDEEFRDFSLITLRDFFLWAEEDELYVQHDGDGLALGLDADEQVLRMFDATESVGNRPFEARLASGLQHIEIDLAARSFNPEETAARLRWHERQWNTVDNKSAGYVADFSKLTYLLEGHHSGGEDLQGAPSYYELFRMRNVLRVLHSAGPITLRAYCTAVECTDVYVRGSLWGSKLLLSDHTEVPRFIWLYHPSLFIRNAVKMFMRRGGEGSHLGEAVVEAKVLSLPMELRWKVIQHLLGSYRGLRVLPDYSGIEGLSTQGRELSEHPWDRKRWPLQSGDLNLDDGCPNFLEKCFDEGGHPIDAEIQNQKSEWAALESTQRELEVFGGDVLNGRSFLEQNLLSLRNPGDMKYTKCPEASRAPDVPRGKVVFFEKYRRPGSELYPDVTHDLWIYAPANTDAPPGLLVCCDGEGWLDEGPRSDVAACAVLDTLMHARDIPSTAAIFINAGQHPEKGGGQRKIEYDLCNGDYARFLTELIPLVEKTIGCALSVEPSKRVICGVSSGGNCAFQAAWHQPETFGCVISACGTFVNMSPLVSLALDGKLPEGVPGAEFTPYKIRMTPRKEIKVFMVSGENDSNHALGNWPLANKLMVDALEYAGYNVRSVFGLGSHSTRHIGSLFAEALCWSLNP